MAKITLSDLSSLTNEQSAVAVINANNQAIRDALDQAVFRNGTTPNQMNADLDMNGNDLLNVGAITFGSSGTAIEDALIGTPDVTTDNALVRWDGTDGTAIQDSGWVLSDADVMTAGGSLSMGTNQITGVTNLTMTGSGSINGADCVLTRVELKDVSETAYNLGNLTGNVSLDYTNGQWQYGVLTGNITITGVTNWPATGKVGSINLEIDQSAGGSNTVSWDTEFEFAGGTAPTQTATANATDIYVVTSRDAGTTVRVVTAGQDFS